MTPDKIIIGKATLYLGRCEDVLPALGPVAALISDVPYGKGEKTARSTRKSRASLPNSCRHAPEHRRDWPKIEGDDRPFDPAPLLGLAPKIVLFGGNHFASRLPDASKWIVWDKREGGTSDDNADCELIWTNLGGPARLYRQLWRGMVRRGEENGQELEHPTQKPVALMERLVAECQLSPGSIVLDPYMGTGSTGVAALRGGHSFIGMEIVPEYFEVACRRVAAAQKQGQLFDAA